MNEYDKLEYIHSAIQEGDEDMLKQALEFVEEIREKHPQAPWNMED